jgi:hypothetical protein
VTDAQLTLLLAALTTVGGLLVGTLRWAVGRITKSNDDGTQALIANTASNAVLVVKIDNLANRIDSIGDFVLEERSGVHDSYDVQSRREAAKQAGKLPRRTTPARGGYYGPVRPKTDTDT